MSMREIELETFSDKLSAIARRIDKELEEVVKESKKEPVVIDEPVGVLYDVWLRALPLVDGKLFINKRVVLNVLKHEALKWVERLNRKYYLKSEYVSVEGTKVEIKYWAEEIEKGTSTDIFYNPRPIMREIQP